MIAATIVNAMVSGSFVSSSQNIGKAKPIANRELAKNIALRPILSESQPNNGIAASAMMAEYRMALRITLCGRPSWPVT
jgi:hypothetical protein